ncbi:MAG: glycosyl hydrolase family 38, partial [Turicibacter sp.]
ACIQGYDDIFLYDDTREVIKYNQTYENKHVKISWDKERGIIGWYDKVNHVELFDDSSKAGAFMPVYELTKGRGQTSGDQYAVRSSLGRNMRGANHEVFYPTINSITVSQMGEIYGKINFDLELEGTRMIKVELKVYNEMNKVEVNVMMNKDSVWDPESLYIALPFAFNNQKMDLFAQKTGSVIQVKKDQLLGTNCDYYLVQEGIGLKHEDFGISIAMPDSSLIYTSPLAFENAKKLYHENYTNPLDYELYSWPMNNLWETNFKASLGGFIEFNYAMSWSNDNDSKVDLINRNYDMNIGLVSYRID